MSFLCWVQETSEWHVVLNIYCYQLQANIILIFASYNFNNPKVLIFQIIPYFMRYEVIENIILLNMQNPLLEKLP